MGAVPTGSNPAPARVEVPEGWNGTLVLYSHGYFPPDFPTEGIALTNSEKTETWLLDHGYALAASNFTTPVGFHVESAYVDQLALLDWFDANIAEPRQVVATGQSMGGVVATRLGEEHPGRIDGVAAVCGAHDANATMNTGLDVVFAVQVLLAGDQDIDIVHPTDAVNDTNTLVAAVEAARGTAEGRAKLALIASLNNITGWWSALASAATRRPTWESTTPASCSDRARPRRCATPTAGPGSRCGTTWTTWPLRPGTSTPGSPGSRPTTRWCSACRSTPSPRP